MKHVDSLSEPRRVLFQEGQVLRAADLQGDQGYQIEGRYRHQRQLHQAGIVAGLVLQSFGTGIVLGPGMALDHAGHEIIVGSARATDAQELTAALRCVGLDPTKAVALDLWLGYHEADPNAPDNPLAAAAAPRLVENYQVYYTDPAQSDAIAGDRVFLGTITKDGSGWEVRSGERVYVRATGSEVVSPSKRTRLLLVPEGPSDPRCFAVSVGSGQPPQFSDRLTVNADGDIRIAGRTTLAKPGGGTGATLIVAHRRALVLRAELIQPRRLLTQLRQPNKDAGVEQFLWNNHLREEEQGRLSAVDPSAALNPRTKLTLLRMLNRAIIADGHDQLVPKDKPLRPETARLLQAALAQSPRGNDRERLCRLLLEDAFPDLIAPLPTAYDGPLGVAFADARPEPKQALPGQVYRTAVKTKTGVSQVLRLEFTDPGKSADPANYRCVFGVEGRRGDDGKPLPFLPLLTVDATNTVTVTGSLSVDAGAGQLIQTIPAADPNDPAAQLRLISALLPANLKIVATKVQPRDPIAKTPLRVVVQVWNTGQVPLQSAQINGSATNLSTNVSQGFAVAQGVSVPPTVDRPLEYTVDLSPLEAATGVEVFIGLLLVGLGPADNILQASFGKNLPVQ